MNLLTAKIFSVVLVFVAGWLGGRLALRGRRQKLDSPWISLGNALAAGIFLGMGLIHLLADADHSWRQMGWDYPVAFVLAAAAFALILLIEHVLLSESAHAMTHAHAGSPAHAGESLAEGTPLHVYGLLLGLSFHSVLAGVALGLQPEITEVSAILVAILAHKVTEGLALGMSLMPSVSESRSRRLIMVFALTTPLGVLLGLVGRGLIQPRTGLAFDASVSALAAGAFVYIASMDMLQDEMLKPGNRWTKWLAASLGLALTAALAAWI